VIAVDARVVIAHLWPDDEHHRAATDLLRELVNDDLVIHPMNLAEVLVGGARVGRAEEMQRDIEAVGVRAAVPSEGEPLHLARLRAERGLRLPDCCALHTAISHAADLATFDQGLRSVAWSLGVAVRP
jgi:predicted nucleic acid-binding protein